MIRALRAGLVWLLMLALPVQNALAATMALCGSSSFAAASLVLDIGGNGSEPSPHCHPAAPREPSAADPFGPGPAGEVFHVADATVVDPAATLTHAEGHNCSVCAACCSAAAVNNEVPLIADPGADPATFLCVVQSVAPFAAGGPDRPPRPLVL